MVELVSRFLVIVIAGCSNLLSTSNLWPSTPFWIVCRLCNLYFSFGMLEKIAVTPSCFFIWHPFNLLCAIEKATKVSDPNILIVHINHLRTYAGRNREVVEPGRDCKKIFVQNRHAECGLTSERHESTAPLLILPLEYLPSAKHLSNTKDPGACFS